MIHITSGLPYAPIRIHTKEHWRPDWLLHSPTASFSHHFTRCHMRIQNQWTQLFTAITPTNHHRCRPSASSADFNTNAKSTAISEPFSKIPTTTNHPRNNSIIEVSIDDRAGEEGSNHTRLGSISLTSSYRRRRTFRRFRWPPTATLGWYYERWLCWWGRMTDVGGEQSLWRRYSGWWVLQWMHFMSCSEMMDFWGRNPICRLA